MDVAASAILDATRLAKELGHAAVVLKQVRARGQYKAADSWKPADDGWQVVWLVSTTGKVVRQ